MKTRKIAIILIILLLTIPLTTAKTQANPLAIPTILLPGALGGPIGLAVAGGIAIGTTIIIQYAPTITGIIKTWFKPVSKTSPSVIHPRTPDQYKPRVKHTAYNSEKSLKEIRKQKRRLIQGRHDTSEASAERMIKKKGYRIVRKQYRQYYIQYRSQILRYAEKIKNKLKSLGIPEDKIDEAIKNIRKGQYFDVDYKVSKNGEYAYIETKSGYATFRNKVIRKSYSSNDIKEFILYSWFKKYKGWKIIYHFEKIGGLRKLLTLAKVEKMDVWIGG